MNLRHLCLLVVFVGLVTVMPWRVEAQGSSPEHNADPVAREAFERGRDAYEGGRFGEALMHFDRAYELSPHPLLLYNIGRAAEADLQNARAVTAYEAYLKALERAENREFVEARLAKLRQLERRRAQEELAVGPQPLPAGPRKSAAQQDAAAGIAETPPRTSTPVTAIPRVRLHVGAHLGALGRGTFEVDGYAPERATLKPSFGVQVGASYGWRFFALGPELRLSFLEVPYDARRKAVDIVARPMPGYPFSRIPLTLYAALPAGLSVPLFDDRSYKLGASLGLFAGAAYDFSRQVGLSLETGWVVRRYGHSSKAVDGGPSATLTLREWNVARLSVVIGI